MKVESVASPRKPARAWLTRANVSWVRSSASPGPPRRARDRRILTWNSSYTRWKPSAAPLGVPLMSGFYPLPRARTRRPGRRRRDRPLAERQAHAHQGARAAAASRLAALAVERRVDRQGSLCGVDCKREVEQHPVSLEVLHLAPVRERDVGDQLGKALDDAQHRFGRVAQDQAGRAGDIHEERGQATSHALLFSSA